jgi:hypothetical protein
VSEKPVDNGFVIEDGMEYALERRLAQQRLLEPNGNLSGSFTKEAI